MARSLYALISVWLLFVCQPFQLFSQECDSTLPESTLIGSQHQNTSGSDAQSFTITAGGSDIEITGLRFFFNGGYGDAHSYTLYKRTLPGFAGENWSTSQWEVVQSGSATNVWDPIVQGGEWTNFGPTAGANISFPPVQIEAGQSQAFSIVGVSRTIITQPTWCEYITEGCYVSGGPAGTVTSSNGALTLYVGPEASPNAIAGNSVYGALWGNINYRFSSFGCTDSAACNYSSHAVCDDESCILPDGCTDEGAANYQASNLCDDGSCEYPGCTDPNECNYDPTANVNDGSCGGLSACMDSGACNYNVAAVCDDGSCVFPGCTNPASCNYDAEACTDDGSCLQTGCMDETACNYSPDAECELDDSCLIAGCTDNDYCNYDPYAYCDDGSCEGALGCNDEQACNYDESSDCNDGSCLFPGCTDSSACNYASNAGCDDGTCILPDGCTIPNSCNFDPDATCNDGSCITLPLKTIIGSEHSNTSGSDAQSFTITAGGSDIEISGLRFFFNGGYGDAHSYILYKRTLPGFAGENWSTSQWEVVQSGSATNVWDPVFKVGSGRILVLLLEPIFLSLLF